MSTSNKVKFGFKNVYYAPVTDSGYGTPVKLDGAVSISLTASGDSVEFYADDSKYWGDENNNGYEGSLEMALIPDDFKIACLGATKDTNNVIVEDATKTTTPFALLCEFTGDSNARKFVFYQCQASRPEISAQTKGESKEVKTESIDIKIRPNSDGIVMRYTTAETTETTLSGWYTKVYEGV